MNAQHFLTHVRGPLEDAGVSIPGSKQRILNQLARQYDGVGRFDFTAAAREVGVIFADDDHYHPRIEKAIEKNLRRGPFY